MNDENGITDEIRARYVRDDRIPYPAEVAVYERNGTVTLRGSVGSIPQIRAAVEIAKSVRGVRTVVNEVTLDPRDHWDDNEIKGAALQALMPISEAPGNQIDVKVGSGWITLKGMVKHQRESNAAFEAVADLPHVGGVKNEIKVITAGG
jgi:hyperosmotically inducible periplasmic protein